MDFVVQPWQLYLVILAGWVNCQQQQVIEYLRTENQVIIEPGEEIGRCEGEIECRERLGGMLRYYYRDAA